MRTLEDLRDRCVIKHGEECWHIRTARGRPPQPRKVLKLWLPGYGAISATRVAWVLSGRELRPGVTIGRTCAHSDCVRPEHLAEMTRRQIGARIVQLGRHRTAAKLAALRKLADMRRAVPTWALESLLEPGVTRAALAARFGCSVGCISAWRRRARARFGSEPPAAREPN